MKLLSVSLACICNVLMAFSSHAQIEDFDDIKLYTLKNKSGMTVKITNYGAIVTSIIVSDRDGKMADVALGYNSVERYINASDRPYFGAIVGRYANRIANGTFTLNGKEYKLATNNGENHLHGGNIGFDKVVWKANYNKLQNSVNLKYFAKDMEEGYPSRLDVTVTYQLTEENELKVLYKALTDKITHVNLTHHTYFNLKGEGEGDILDHELMLNAKYYTPVDVTLIPTGEIAEVKGTPFNFTSPKTIGQDIKKQHEQLDFGGGFDHNWVLDKGENSKGITLAARVYEPTSGRVLEVLTTDIGVQFYCGNFLDGRLSGKAGKSYIKRGGFCLEPQHFPDSPNQPNFPSTILKRGQAYQKETIYKFSTK
jgi:aldose 1-epimerase